MPQQPKRFYEFGPFRLDVAQRILLREGQHISLTLKAYETLLALVENNGRILDKEYLLNRVWPDAFIEEATLAKNISTLRKVLAERDGTQEYIETIPKRGYRFVVEVKVVATEEAPPTLPEYAPPKISTEKNDPAPALPLLGEQENSRRHTRWRRVMAVGVLLAILTAVGFFWQTLKRDQGQETANIKTLAVLPFRFLGAEKEERYLGQGLTDILITRLGSTKKLVVRPTSAVLHYEGETRAAAAGRELKVDAVLEGSLQKFGQQLRVSVQLVRTAGAIIIWTGEFEASNLFLLEDRLAAEVV